MLRKEVQAGGYRVNAERSDPPESHVCVLTMMVQGESYRLRQKRKAGLRLHSAPPLES